MKRKPMSKKLRFEVFKRDGFVCQYCGAHPPAVVLHVDHIIPVCEGGANDIDNLVSSCDACNLGKGPRQLSSIPASLQDRAAEVAEREAQVRGYAQVMAAQRERVESDCWEVANRFIDYFGLEGIRRDWLRSIKTFVLRIGVHECLEAMEIAIGKMPWRSAGCFRYFCGICWNKVREVEGG